MMWLTSSWQVQEVGSAQGRKKLGTDRRTTYFQMALELQKESYVAFEGRLDLLKFKFLNTRVHKTQKEI